MAIALLLIVQFALIFTHAVNWDESYHYGQLYDLATGQPLGALQTLYLRAYTWIVALPGNAIDHVVIARIGQWLCEWVTLAMIFVLARRFVDRTSAIVATLAYLATGYILQHGFALRADPMVTAVLIAALALFTRSTLGWRGILGVGLLAGFAPMLSIKAVLYAPAFAGIAWLRWCEFGRTGKAALRFVAIGAIAIATFAIVFALHSAMLAPKVAAVDGSIGLANSAASRMFFIGRPNNLGSLIQGILTGLGLTSLVVAAPFAIAKRAGSRAEKIALAGLLLPAVLPFVYENTAPYFYVFMLAPVAVACATSVAWLRPKIPAMVMTALLVALAIPVAIGDNRTTIDNQRRLATELDAMFPAPVAYFDHADVAPRNFKRNPMLTPWGYRGYLHRGVPVYRQTMEREPVPLLVPNWWVLRGMLNGSDEFFLPEDAKVLRENYLPFNGPIWLAGKTIAPGPAKAVEILVPGPYTVRDANVVIDGVNHAIGAIVLLNRGEHRIAATGGGTPARLVWGNRIEPRDRLDFQATWVPF
ncbi:ArnT family glycosyltransferase [Croceicoccus ponticola]|nr:hypothetical protein [Croceicoccus ponticola]